MKISVNMEDAVRGRIHECGQPRSKELCRGVLPQYGAIISTQGRQVSQRSAHSAMRSAACGSRRVALRAQPISAHGSVSAKTWVKTASGLRWCASGIPDQSKHGSFPDAMLPLKNGEARS
jgi:hypothetical protein